MSFHPSIGKVTTVRHTLLTTSGWVHVCSDLIFVGGMPTVVLEWEMRPDGDVPAVAIPLDPRSLHKLGWKSAEYMYEHGLEDPRGPQQAQYQQLRCED